MSTFFLKISTPDAEVYSGEVEYLSIDTLNGRAGFMRGALPSLGVLKSGRIEIKRDGSAQVFDCGDGIFKISSDGVTIITSHCNGDDSVSGMQSGADNQSALDYAKVKIASSILGMKDKNKSDD